jgi:hypothetical protein
MADGATIDSKLMFCHYGPLQLNGRGSPKGQWLTIDYVSDGVTVTEGLDDEACYVQHNGKAGIMTVSLLESADLNGSLSDLHEVAMNTPGGLVLPWTGRRQNGGSIYVADTARIVRHAPGVWSDGAEVRVWTFVTTRLISRVGGISATPVNPNP